MYNIYSYSRLENLNQIHTQCVLSEKDDSINNVACNEKIRSNFVNLLLILMTLIHGHGQFFSF